MEKIQNYTLIDLINKYKDLVGEEIVEVIISSLMPTNKEGSEEFRKDINRTINKVKEYLKIPVPEEQKKKIIINAIYKDLEYLFSDEDLDNNIERNKRFLMEIHRKFSEKMTKKQKNELLDLILGNEDFAVYSFLSDTYPGVKEVGIITRKNPEKISDTKSRKEQEIIKVSLEQAYNDGYFENIIKDEYENYYMPIMTKSVIDFCLKNGRMSIEEYRSILENDNNLNNIEMTEFKKAILRFFENNYQYIDEERLLLNMGARLMLGIKLEKGEKIDGVESNAKEISEKDKQIARMNSIATLREIYYMLNSRKFENKEFGVLNSNGEIVIKASRNSIEDFLSKCTDSNYITDKEIETIHKNLLEGNLTADIKEREIAGVNIDDLIKMMEVYNEENKDKILPCATELTEYLKTTKEITNEQLIDLYINNKINLDLMDSINLEEISENFFREKLENMFSEITDCKEAEEKQKQFKQLTRLTDLYKLLAQKGNFEIYKDKIIENVLANYNERNMNQAISDLHKIGLITLEEAIEWTGTDSIIKRYQEGTLKPAEVRLCYDKGKLTLDDLARIIKIMPENSERFMMIGGIFPSEEDFDTREILMLECMELEEGLKRERKGIKNENSEHKEPIYSNKYITDPFARLSLIQELDSEYSFEMLGDGHAVIMLPTLKKVIIEKMLDKNNFPSYGSATYLLDEAYYEKNYEEIVIGNKINRSKMIKDLENDGVDRIIHGIESWGRNIKEYFGIEEKSRWTDEDIKKIDDAIERIKRTYRTI